MAINWKLTSTKFWDFNGIQTHSLCISTAVLYQLSCEDPDIVGTPICWLHLNPLKEWNTAAKIQFYIYFNEKYIISLLNYIILFSNHPLII